MVSLEEVDFNVAYFNGTYDPEKTPTVKAIPSNTRYSPIFVRDANLRCGMPKLCDRV